MKQGVLRGFGASYLSAAKPPLDMPAEIVASCQSEADAIRRSIEYARRRFGYRQIDIAKLCGWSSDNHLSTYKKNPDVLMPASRRTRFAQVTGCNLLEQYEMSKLATADAAGAATMNRRDDVIVARMLAVPEQRAAA